MIYQEALRTFSIQIYQTEIPLWVLFTPSRQGLYSLEPSVHHCRMNRRGGQTDIRLQCKKEVLKSRRERSWAAHLVADRLIPEPRLVQDLLQLLVVEVGHPDRLGQSYTLTLLQGLGGKGGEQSLGMGNRIRIKTEKKICKKCHPSRISVYYQGGKRGRRHDIKRNIVCSLNPREDISHRRKEMPVCTSHILLLHSSLWTFQQWFPPHKPSMPALRFMICWVCWSMAHSHRWKKGRRFPLSWLLPGLSTPHTHLPCATGIHWVSYHFPFSSLGYNSFPGYNRSSHFRDITK